MAEPTWDEMNQLEDYEPSPYNGDFDDGYEDDGWDEVWEDDWPDATCPECGMSGWDCTCNEWWYTDEEVTEYHPNRNLREWAYYTYRRVYFWVCRHLPNWLYTRLFPERDEVPF